MSHRYEGPRPRKSGRFTFPDHQAWQVIIKIARDLVILILGAYAFVYELTREGPERPQILIMSAAMMGLPLIIRGDEKRQETQTNAINKQRDSERSAPTSQEVP